MTAPILAGEAQSLLVLIGKNLDRKGDEFFKEIGLSASQFEIMRFLWHQDNLTLGELSQLCDCAPPNITGLVDRLESKGLLSRVIDKADRRIIRIVLTGSGNELRLPTAHILEKYLSIFEVYDSQELSLLVNLLKKFYRHIEEDRSEQVLKVLEYRPPSQ